MGCEIETKFKIKDPEGFRKKLVDMKAEFLSRCLEQDTFYSFPGGKSKVEGVRLRTIDNKQGLFTIKEYLDDKDAAVYKVRQETEVFVDDAKKFDTMLQKIGLVPMMRKEKIRETYSLDTTTVVLDQLPYIGFYAEIEAPKEDICKAAILLGLEMNKAIPDSYLELFRMYKLAKGTPQLNMVFDENME